MKSFRVWAPLPKTVELRIGSQTVPMTSENNGWWSARVSADEAANDYGFILDGQGPFPDPRSAWQPNGVHGLSRLSSLDSYRRTAGGWRAPPLSSAIVYELHTGTFTPEGTFTAAIGKLEHLVKLGVTHVELMPVNEFAGTRGWGYDGVDLYAPHHSYGGPAGLKQFVDACHAHDLAVLLDVVYNHLGPSGNYLAKFGPYYTRRYPVAWGEAINFDGPDSDEVRRFFCDNALMWLRDYHFDGLRLDAVHAIFDTSAEPFLEQLAREIDELEAKLGRPLILIPESDLNDPRLLWSREHGGFGLDAQWSDDFHHALHSVLTGETNGYYSGYGKIADLCKALKEAFVFDGRYSSVRKRRHGRPIGGLSGHHFLGYLQNHDQIGNRAQGDRSSQLMSAGRLKIGAALVLTSPFVPMLFQGEEWGASNPFLYFTDFSEPELATAVRQGRCREFEAFGWKPEEIPDPQARKTFQRSKLDWSEQLKTEHADLLEWHKKLIRLRRAEISLSDGRLDSVVTNHDDQEKWLTIERGPITIACNLAPRPQNIPLRPGAHRCLLSSATPIETNSARIHLPPDSVAILKTDD